MAVDENGNYILTPYTGEKQKEYLVLEPFSSNKESSSINHTEIVRGTQEVVLEKLKTYPQSMLEKLEIYEIKEVHITIGLE